MTERRYTTCRNFLDPSAGGGWGGKQSSWQWHRWSFRLSTKFQVQCLSFSQLIKMEEMLKSQQEPSRVKFDCFIVTSREMPQSRRQLSLSWHGWHSKYIVSVTRRSARRLTEKSADGQKSITIYVIIVYLWQLEPRVYFRNQNLYMYLSSCKLNYINFLSISFFINYIMINKTIRVTIL